MRKVLFVFFLGVSGLISGCATDAYYRAKDSCRNLAFQQVPPQIVQRTFEESYLVRVPDGNVSCTSSTFGGTTRTNCQEGTRLETRYRNVVRDVDAMESARNQYISTCTRNTCFNQFGNGSCE